MAKRVYLTEGGTRTLVVGKFRHMTLELITALADEEFSIDYKELVAQMGEQLELSKRQAYMALHKMAVDSHIIIEG